MAGSETYRETHIMTASPMELITMLYDECIASLEKAEEAFNLEGPERFQEISNNILHAQDIITELSVSLNMEEGGKIAENLQRLYDFMVSHLCNANVKKNAQPIKEIRELMTELGDAWKQVAAKEPGREPDFSSRGTGNIVMKG